jgi:hypothetical protein
MAQGVLQRYNQQQPATSLSSAPVPAPAAAQPKSANPQPSYPQGLVLDTGEALAPVPQQRAPSPVREPAPAAPQEGRMMLGLLLNPDLESASASESEEDDDF